MGFHQEVIFTTTKKRPITFLSFGKHLPVYQRLKYTVWRLTGTGAGESFTAACRSRLRVTWAHGPFPHVFILPLFWKHFSGARHWAGHKRHRHHQVTLLVPEEVVLPAILSALYIVTRLTLAKALEGTLTLPILQMRKLDSERLRHLHKDTANRLWSWHINLGNFMLF